MTWQDKPTSTGYYWCYDPQQETGLYYVEYSGVDEEPSITDGAFTWHIDEFEGCKWYGPLEPPEYKE